MSASNIVRFLRELSVPVLGMFLLTGCVSPSSQLVKSGERGIVLEGYELRGDFKQGGLTGKYARYYRLNKFFQTKEMLDGVDPPRDRTRGEVLKITEEDRVYRVLRVWRMFAVEPGEYYITALVEQMAARDEALRGKRLTTSFLRRRKPDDGPNPSARIYENTPRITVAPGQVIYIGTFGAQLETESFYLGRLISDAAKFYRFEPCAAKAVAADSWLADYELKTSNIFERRTRSLELLETTLKQRPRPRKQAK